MLEDARETSVGVAIELLPNFLSKFSSSESISIGADCREDLHGLSGEEYKNYVLMKVLVTW